MADEKKSDSSGTKPADSRELTAADDDRRPPKGAIRADEKPPPQDPGPKAGRGLPKQR